MRHIECGCCGAKYGARLYSMIVITCPECGDSHSQGPTGVVLPNENKTTHNE